MISKKRIFLLTTLLFFSATSFAQNIRGFYITGIGNWLGNTTKENQILVYAQGNGFNYINFYDLGSINFNSATDKNKLAAFMSRARTQYGVLQFGAIVETYAYLTANIIPYNNSRTNANEKFDVINLEFEFWVTSTVTSQYCSKFLSNAGYSCDTAGAFRFALKQFKQIDSLCGVLGLISEVYLGWPTKGQMQQLAAIADRILLHAYRPTDSDVYAYSKNRLSDIGTMGAIKKVIPLFSSEPSFMGPWLNSHPITKPYQTYSGNLAAETAAFKTNISLQGYHWFTYQNMPYTLMASASISASGPLTFCSGGSVTLTANSGTSYLWSPGGATTQSITVSTAGSFTVAVTDANGVSASSAPAVVTISTTGVTPTVSVTGATSFCPGGSVTLTSSQSGTYLWSNGATTQSINVTTSGNFTVTTGTGTCSATSAPVSITALPAPSTPTVTASGSLNICPGTQLTLTSSAANGYLWSNGATTQSIVVSAAGNYSINAYSGPNCFASSAVQTVTLLTAPATPVITPGGSTVLSTSNPSVVLTSSTANGYLWSTGATTNSITVGSSGNYIVTAIGTNGCQAASNAITVTGTGCVPPPVPVITLTGSNVISPGQTVVLTSSIAAGYLWSTGETTRSILVSTGGAFTVTVYNSGSCYTISLPTVITMVSTGVNELQKQSENINYSLYPNPASNEFNITFTLGKHKIVTMNLLDVTGREILRREIDGVAGENKVHVSVSDLSRGIYFACMKNDDQMQMIKFVIE